MKRSPEAARFIKPSVVAIAFAALVFGEEVQASILSRVLTNTNKTIEKATKDTNAEINRAKEKVIASGPTLPATTPSHEKQVAVTEIDSLGKQLLDAKTEKIELEGEKKLSDGLVVALAAAAAGGVIAMASTGMFGRYDRRDKYLAAIERELNLAERGFDFTTVPKYRRLSQRNPPSVP
jgi:hypothetical protein